VAADLRKQARQLENELDLKLVSFSKLCISYSHGSSRDGRRDRYRYYHHLNFDFHGDAAKVVTVKTP
uniref:Uncharacterized protein n=1 Tax=Naja naja TaxID=35670 RepID=A0A8C6V555_NAJNA